MKKSLIVLLACALSAPFAFAQEPPAEKPPGGEMPDRPEGGTMAGKPEGGTLPGKPEGGSMSDAAYAANTQCSVEGTWYSMTPKTEKNPEGKQVSTSFSGGSFSTTTMNGKRTATYTVAGSTITFSGGSSSKAPKGDGSAVCADAGAYEAQFTSDCGSFRLRTSSDACEHRKKMIESTTYHRAKKN